MKFSYAIRSMRNVFQQGKIKHEKKWVSKNCREIAVRLSIVCVGGGVSLPLTEFLFHFYYIYFSQLIRPNAGQTCCRLSVNARQQPLKVAHTQHITTLSSSLIEFGCHNRLKDSTIECCDWNRLEFPRASFFARLLIFSSVGTHEKHSQITRRASRLMNFPFNW